MIINTTLGRGAATTLLALGTFLTTHYASAAETIRVYVGTYTDNGSEGIYVCELNLATGALENVRVAAQAKNPSFLAFHPNKKFLYATSEVDDFADSNGGALSAFAIDDATGSLNQLNSQSSAGAGPCHVSVDHTGQCVLVANYGAGSVAALPIAEDGTLHSAKTLIEIHAAGDDTKSNEAKVALAPMPKLPQLGPNTKRQSAPHAHSINISPDNRFAVLADLGTDQLSVLSLDSENADFQFQEPPVAARLAPGSGPRHFTFHPNGRWAYVINELTSTITAFEYDAKNGKLEEAQTTTTLPAGFTGQNTTAEIQVHPTGKFLYGSNRGHDSIAMFSVDQQNGKLTPLGHHPTGGRTPRNFGIDPTGAWLLAANQNSDTVTVHRIDPQFGKLATTDHVAKIPTPVCIKMLLTSER